MTSAQLSWNISGMDCPSCAAKIEKAVQGLQGVKAVRVAFATERLIVVTENVQSPEFIKKDVLSALHQLGFSATEGTATSKTESFLKKYWRIIALAAVMLIASIIQTAFPTVSSGLFCLATLCGLLPILAKAWQLAHKGSPFSIETLMSVAAIGALFLGETAEAAMVLLLFLLGEHMESYAAGRARQGVQKLMELTPQTALQISTNGRRAEVSAHKLQPGDVIEVLPGSRLPVDGELLTPHTSFDESSLTGESIPVERNQGDHVMAGSLTVNRVARFRVVSEPGDNAVDRIIRLIEEAEERKAPVERFIDAFSRWYTPLMILIALLVALVPPLALAAPWQEWVYKALTLLLIACPCALVISTPAAVTSALARASRNGALVKGGAAIELLGTVKTIAFDKTGTLTEGRPVVTGVTPFACTEEEVIRLAAAVESSSTHPLAKAIVSKASELGLVLPEATEVEAKAGLGVQGLVENSTVVVASPHYLHSLIAKTNGATGQLETLESNGNSIAVVMSEQRLLGFIALRDNTRSGAQSVIESLKSMGITSVMLTGDNPRAAAAIAAKLKIDYRAQLLPGDKSSTVETLRQEGRIAMVGDGINDAPALKAADIGIAMGSGADVALDTADCALTHNRVEELTSLISLSRATMAIIRQNIALAVGSKALFLLTTVLGMTGLWVAVIADTGTTALVTANALRLLRRKDEH